MPSWLERTGTLLEACTRQLGCWGMLEGRRRGGGGGGQCARARDVHAAMAHAFFAAGRQGQTLVGESPLWSILKPKSGNKYR
jgi:hypothetical protein